MTLRITRSVGRNESTGDPACPWKFKSVLQERVETNLNHGSRLNVPLKIKRTSKMSVLSGEV